MTKRKTNGFYLKRTLPHPHTDEARHNSTPQQEQGPAQDTQSSPVGDLSQVTHNRAKRRICANGSGRGRQRNEPTLIFKKVHRYRFGYLQMSMSNVDSGPLQMSMDMSKISTRGGGRV